MGPSLYNIQCESKKKNQLVKNFTINYNDNKNIDDNRTVFLSNENSQQHTIPTA